MSADSRPYASAVDVLDELDAYGIDGTQYTQNRIEKWLKRAVRVLDQRLPNERDTEHLADLEVLIASHFAYPSATFYKGQELSSITQESAQISFENSSSSREGPGGYSSPFWEQAVLLDHRLEDERGDWWSVSRTAGR